MPSPYKLGYISFALLCLVTIFLPTHAYCSGEAIARLTDFSGIVLIKSRGEWGIKPETNLPLYSQDKVVTRIGTATVSFSDGATIDIKNNSNLFIDERETEAGLVKKVKIVERRIILFLGKMFFKTGTGQVQTHFETEKTVIGIRGTAGILSIGPDGEVYITFTQGGPKGVKGKVKIGEIAKDVLTKVADQNPLQTAAYMAHAAYDRCLDAQKKYLEGKMAYSQVLYFCAIAKELTATEFIACAERMINNPHIKDPEFWNGVIEIEKDNVNSAIKEREDALIDGAIPEPLEYKPPGEEGIPEGFSEKIEAIQVDKTIDLQQQYSEEIPISISPTGKE